MGNMLTAQVEIEGTRPLLWHRFGPESIPLEKQEKSGVAGHDPLEWKKTYSASADGQLYLDGSYIFGALRGGAVYTKKGRGSIQKPLVATLQVADTRVLIDRFMPCEAMNGGGLTDDDASDVYLDIRAVVNPSTRGRNVRYRVATRTGWKARFGLEWDRTIISRGEMEAVVIDAGRLVGVGSGRAIGFGRFRLVSFEVTAA